MTSHGLIDTTEMYLRTVFELEEEGIVPLRARIAERLSQSGPTVSQTVARMERDGLLRVEGDRHLALTESGRGLATRVMRKHRLAECLLINVIGLPWEDVHIEACRWEHVMSEEVERRLVALLDNPTHCPHGNPIPALDELGGRSDEDSHEALFAMTDALTQAAVTGAMTSAVAGAKGAQAGPRAATRAATRAGAAGEGGARVIVRRISEQVQSDSDLMLKLKQIGIQPGREVTLAASDDGVRVTCDDQTGGQETELPRHIAEHVFVARR